MNPNRVNTVWKLQEFLGHNGNVNCCRLGTKSGQILGTGGEDKRVNVWQVGNPQALVTLTGHSSAPQSLVFDQGEESLVVGCAGGSLVVWDLEQKKTQVSFTGHRTTCACVEFHPYGDFFASGSLDTNMKIWDMRRKTCIQTYRGHTAGVTCVRFSPHGRWVATAGQDSTIKLWDLTAGKLLKEFFLHKAPITDMDFHPEEFLLATSSMDRTVKTWNLEEMKQAESADVGSNPSQIARFYTESKSVACASCDQLRLYPVGNLGSAPTEVFDTDWGAHLKDLQISANNKLLAISSEASTVEVWVGNLKQAVKTREAPATVGNTHTVPAKSRPAPGHASVGFPPKATPETKVGGRRRNKEPLDTGCKKKPTTKARAEPRPEPRPDLSKFESMVGGSSSSFAGADVAGGNSLTRPYLRRDDPLADLIPETKVQRNVNDVVPKPGTGEAHFQQFKDDRAQDSVGSKTRGHQASSGHTSSTHSGSASLSSSSKGTYGVPPMRKPQESTVPSLSLDYNEEDYFGKVSPPQTASTRTDTTVHDEHQHSSSSASSSGGPNYTQSGGAHASNSNPGSINAGKRNVRNKLNQNMPADQSTPAKTVNKAGSSTTLSFADYVQDMGKKIPKDILRGVNLAPKNNPDAKGEPNSPVNYVVEKPQKIPRERRNSTERMDSQKEREEPQKPVLRKFEKEEPRDFNATNILHPDGLNSSDGERTVFGQTFLPSGVAERVSLSEKPTPNLDNKSSPGEKSTGYDSPTLANVNNTVNRAKQLFEQMSSASLDKSPSLEEMKSGRNKTRSPTMPGNSVIPKRAPQNDGDESDGFMASPPKQSALRGKKRPVALGVRDQHRTTHCLFGEEEKNYVVEKKPTRESHSRENSSSIEGHTSPHGSSNGPTPEDHVVLSARRKSAMVGSSGQSGDVSVPTASGSSNRQRSGPSPKAAGVTRKTNPLASSMDESIARTKAERDKKILSKAEHSQAVNKVADVVNRQHYGLVECFKRRLEQTSAMVKLWNTGQSTQLVSLLCHASCDDTALYECLRTLSAKSGTSKLSLQHCVKILTPVREVLLKSNYNHFNQVGVDFLMSMANCFSSIIIETRQSFRKRVHNKCDFTFEERVERVSDCLREFGLIEQVISKLETSDQQLVRSIKKLNSTLSDIAVKAG